MNENHQTVTIIKPGGNSLFSELVECWQHRQLMYFLALRDMKVRYKQTILGVFWVLLQPLATMIVFTLVFNRLANIKTDVPYPLFALAGLLPWQLFQGALSSASGSIVSESRLLTKVYFPRLLIPFSSVLTVFIDFSITFGMLIVLMYWYRIPLTLNLLFLPLFALLSLFAAMTLGIWFATLNARYRDVRYLMPFITRILLFLSPVAYPSSQLIAAIPESLRPYYYVLNPLAVMLDGFRWSVFGGTELELASLAVSILVMSVIFFGGLCLFRRMERTFADLV